MQGSTETDERAHLSSTLVGGKWLKQFSDADRRDAAELLDFLTTVSEAEVSREIHAQIAKLLPPTGRVALYAEREPTPRTDFPIETYVDAHGQKRRRVVGNARFKPIRTIRGAQRVGSEGWIAFLISQAVKTNPRFVNSPSPDQYRSKNAVNRVHDIVVVTDFIASGNRIYSFLDAFLQTPTFSAWWSRKWVRFHVVAAVTTQRGRAYVLSHPCKPTVRATLVSPTLLDTTAPKADRWIGLAQKYWPLDDDPLGYEETGALVAFEYGFPNNSPAILARRRGGWRPLFEGRAPSDLDEVFTGKRNFSFLLRRLAAHGLRKLHDALYPWKNRARVRNIAFLTGLRGRWHRDSEIEIAGRTGLSVPEVVELHEVALTNGWINNQGRLTDAGRRLIRAAVKSPRQRLQVAPSVQIYYPKALRVP